MNEVSLSDERLALQCQHGNEAAFEVLVHRYHGPLLGYLYRMCRDVDLAEEAAQECFARFCATIDRYRYPGPVRPYLFTIACNCLKDYLKSAYARRVRLYGDVGESEARPSGPSDNDAHDEAVSRLERREVVEALAQLPFIYREALVLRFYQDLSIPEVAKALGVPEGTVKSRLHGAVNKLKRIMEDKGAGECAGDALTTRR
ncbi:MAG: RNA polymerase sigma factor [Clostridia bacterium]|nr:RNA polymerase sigma factor [Clostridia bacterium]